MGPHKIEAKPGPGNRIANDAADGHLDVVTSGVFFDPLSLPYGAVAGLVEQHREPIHLARA